MTHFFQAVTVAATLAAAASSWINPPPDSNSPPADIANPSQAPILNNAPMASHPPAEATKPAFPFPSIAKRSVPHSRRHRPAHVRDHHPAPSEVARGNEITSWLNRQELARTKHSVQYPALPGWPTHRAVYTSPWGYLLH